MDQISSRVPFGQRQDGAVPGGYSPGNDGDVQAATRPRAGKRRVSRKRTDVRREAAPAASRDSLYDAVTARIVVELEAGRMPWVQPWGRGDGSDSEGLAPALPRNALTARRYSGVNILILWGAVIEHSYPSQCWLTFKQAVRREVA
jgi:hypothetical protein